MGVSLGGKDPSGPSGWGAQDTQDVLQEGSLPRLHFKGKVFVENHHLAVPFHELLPVREKGLSEKASLRDNLIVHGDNLRALKSLLPTYHGKVKCVYIDPPYNTGNEGWAYSDSVNSPLIRDWLGRVVDRDDLTRHDKWCCMMLPRLKLLRELLREDGAIFVSIDDNEVHHLRSLMDEVFGEENFVATVIWQKVFSPKNTAKYFSEDHDYVMAYARRIEEWRPNLIERGERAVKRYKNPDDDARGPWSSSDLTARNPYSRGTYEVTSPSGDRFGPAVGRYWVVPIEKFRALDEDGRIWWGKNGDSMPRLKRFLAEVKKGVVPQTLWLHTDVGNTQEAKKELVSTLQFERSEDVFNTVKPSRLVRRILQTATDPDSIVLDSFAGSGTTAHAVLAQNREDGGNRRFILVECEDYADTITAERVRRVIQGVPTAKDDALKAGFGGTFSYFELGRPMAPGVAPRRLPPAIVGEARLLHLLHSDRTGVRPDGDRLRDRVRGEHPHPRCLPLLRARHREAQESRALADRGARPARRIEAEARLRAHQVSGS